MASIPNCYLYYMMDNQFISKSGTVIVSEYYRNAKFEYGIGQYAVCSMEAGKMRCGKVWLPNRDDERAKKILIEYHTSRIDALHKQIESHEQTIQNLEGEG